MAWTLDESNGDIVIGGFQKGIAPSPYSGISDMRSVNIGSRPSEASVAFKNTNTTNGTGSSTSVSVTGASGGGITFANTLGLDNGMAIIFTNLGSLTGSGLNVNQAYWIYNLIGGPSGATGFAIYSTYSSYSSHLGSITIGGTPGGATFKFVTMAQPKYMQKGLYANFFLDSVGYVWCDLFLTGTNNSWTWLGNIPPSDAQGNGLLLMQTVDSNLLGGIAEWLFVMSRGQIDYFNFSTAVGPIQGSPAWVYGWNPSNGSTGNSAYLYGSNFSNVSHFSVQTPDQWVNVCDLNYILTWYQKIPSAGSSYTNFSPTSTSTYVYAYYQILPNTDRAQCLTYINGSRLIGAAKNICYLWAPPNPTYSDPLIILPESNTVNIITVGNVAYIFTGDRGNIYVTNGSQASFFKKVPDHLATVPEPYFSWGGVVENKNRLFFSIQAYNQNSLTLQNYGGIWCIDLGNPSFPLWNTGQSSYGSYTGYITTMIVPTNSGHGWAENVGYGLLTGWSTNSVTSFGIDYSNSTPFTGGQSYVASDMIPLGTAIEPNTPSQIEFKLSQPLASGDTVQILVGQYLDPTYASFVSCKFSGSNTMGYSSGQAIYSGITDGLPLNNFQWIIVQVVLTSASSDSSFLPLTEIRIKNASPKQAALYA